MSDLRLVIFDVDGTLIDSQGHILAAMAAAFSANALPPPSRAATLAIVGLSLPVAMARLAPDHPEAQDDLVAGFAGALAAHACPAVLGEEVLLVAEVDQGVQPLHGLGHDIAAAPAVAPVQAAVFDELLAPEGHAAVPPAAGADVDFG